MLSISLEAHYDASMAKKKPTMSPAASEQKTLAPVRVVFMVPADLVAVADANADDNGRTRTAELVRAIRAYYTSQGLWPPKPS